MGRVAHGGFLAEVASSSDLREVTGEPAMQSPGEELPGEEEREMRGVHRVCPRAR